MVPSQLTSVVHTLNYYHPASPAPYNHPKQLEFLNLNRVGKTVQKIHFISGRAGGKTAGAVQLVVDTCIKEPGCTGLVLAPTVSVLERSFLREWQTAVPPELYTFRRFDKCIYFNNCKIFLSSRYIDNPQKGKDALRGITVDWVLDDEAAWGFDHELYTNVMMCIRGKGRQKFYACTTTPRLNGYHDLVVLEPGHSVVYSTSYDNPHIDDEYITNVAGQMTTQQKKREIGGEWVALEGLIWPDWSFKPWPEGNVIDYRFDPRMPWYLMLDLGSASGAYIVTQLHERTWVACAELMPADDGSAKRAFVQLLNKFGKPRMVIGGADLTTRASTDGRRATYFARSVFGNNVIVKDIYGWQADKQIQYDQLSGVIKDHYGVRRFCISKYFESMGHRSVSTKRGINELMKQDTWPEDVKKSKGPFFPKEGKLEHVRDALLYGAVGIMNPPRMEQTTMYDNAKRQ